MQEVWPKYPFSFWIKEGACGERITRAEQMWTGFNWELCGLCAVPFSSPATFSSRPQIYLI